MSAVAELGHEGPWDDGWLFLANPTCWMRLEAYIGQVADLQSKPLPILNASRDLRW